jgi:hypothetical protein
MAALAVAASADVARNLAGGRSEAVNELWRAVEEDARTLDSGIPPSDVARRPLWPGRAPDWWFSSWRQLARELLHVNSDWKVWTSWFEHRLVGGPVANNALEIARVTIANEIWQQGPRAVNAEIARLISPHGPNAVSRQERVGELSRPEYKVVVEDDSTIVVSFANYAGPLRGFVNALKRSIEKAEFTAIVEAVATKDSLVVSLDPLVVPAAELAEKIGELIEREQIAKSESLKPPDEPLPPPSPAARFSYTNGRFDVAPTSAWRDREVQAGVYHARARALATGLVERLSRTDAVPDVTGSVAALVDVLGATIADVQPDLLRLASRSIAAKARAYGHPAAQWEISAESVSAFFELDAVLIDLQTFVKTDLEAHEQAVRELDLTPEKAAEEKLALDLVTEAILSASEIVGERAHTAFEAAAEVSETAADRDVKVAVEGDRTLLTANLALAVARELGREAEAASPVVQREDQPPDKSSAPEKRRRRTRRVNVTANERSWQEFSDRIVARIYQKGPDRIADATLDSLTSAIRHAPKTVAGLGAALALWGLGSPIVAGGAVATTIGWICYELRKKNKQGKLKDSTN